MPSSSHFSLPALHTVLPPFPAHNINKHVWLQVRMCKRAYDLLLEKLDFDPEDIVFDPNILTVGTGLPEHNNYAVDFIEATRELKKVCCGRCDCISLVVQACRRACDHT